MVSTVRLSGNDLFQHPRFGAPRCQGAPKEDYQMMALIRV
jgi:hypothetical protein